MNPREVELKLLCTPAVLHKLMASSALLTQLSPPSASNLLSTYFDTPGRDLSKSGIILRLRQGNDGMVQTLKADDSDTPAVARDCVEIETLLAKTRTTPDLTRLPDEWQKKLSALIADQMLEPTISTRINRHLAHWKDGKGTEIEIAFDEGEMTVGKASLPICEIELELKAGHAAGLYELALALLAQAPLLVGTRSKAQRGFDLLDQRQPEAFKAGPLTLSREASLEDAYAQILSHCLTHLLGNERAIIQRQDIEALHQARVALRRLRSAFTVFGGVIGGDATDELAQEAKWIGNSVGRARDHDVFVMDILTPAFKANKPDEAMFHLQAVTEIARKKAWEQTCIALTSTRYAQFQLRLGHYLAAQDWRPLAAYDVLAAGSAQVFADAALDKRLSSVMRLGRDIADLDTSDRHELRKRLKKLRYTLGFFASLYPRSAVKSYLDDLGRLQDVFGSLNDVAMATTILERLVANDPELAGPAAQILAWHEEKATADWKAALKLWQRFSRHDPFWHG